MIDWYINYTIGNKFQKEYVVEFVVESQNDDTLPQLKHSLICRQGFLIMPLHNNIIVQTYMQLIARPVRCMYLLQWPRVAVILWTNIMLHRALEYIWQESDIWM